MPRKSPENLHELLILKIKVLYDVEKQLVKALPKMAKAATDPELKKGFTSHLEETKEHVNRLEKIFELLDVAAGSETSDGIRGIIADAEWCIKNIKNKQARDASLIAAAQYAEHFEMAGYGSAAEWAKVMGHDEIKDLLDETLTEEKNADNTLNKAASKVNEAANDMEEPENKKGILGSLKTVME